MMKRRIFTTMLVFCVMFHCTLPCFASSASEVAQPQPPLTEASLSNLSNVGIVYCEDTLLFSDDLQQTIVDEGVRNYILGKAIVNTVVEYCGYRAVEYCLNEFSQDIAEGYDLLGISLLHNSLYVRFQTPAGLIVSNVYSESGIISQAIYDSNNDKLTYIDENQMLIENSVREKMHFEIPQETLDIIYSAIDSGNIEEIYDLPDIEVLENNGVLEISPQGYTTESAQAAEKTNFQDPKNFFAPYTRKYVEKQTKYCAALGKNVNITVKDSMDAYVRKTADFQRFAAGVALSAITVCFGWSESLLLNVLSIIGIAWAGLDYLSEAATLYNSAAYTYRQAREGYVYDTTVYNEDVLVYTYATGRGELHGGLDSDGVFRWINYINPGCFNRDVQTVINASLIMYNDDIEEFGECFSYEPV